MSTDTVVHWNWKLDIPISLAGSVVSYSFSTTPGDISFGIAFEAAGGEEEDVLEEHRVPSHIEPISGAFKAPCEGSVCLYWDNSFSWLTPKKLSYSVEVRQVGAKYFEFSKCLMHIMQPSFAIADQTRSLKAQSMLHSCSSEVEVMEMRLARNIEKEKRVRAEIPELKRQFDHIKALIESKLDEVNTSQREAEELLNAIELAEARVNGLCIR
jgi:hypothetical protein